MSRELLSFLLSYVDFLLRTLILGRRASHYFKICYDDEDICTHWGKKS